MFKVYYFILLFISCCDLLISYSLPIENHQQPIRSVKKRALTSYKNGDKTHYGFHEGEFFQLMKDNFPNKFTPNYAKKDVKDWKLDEKGQVNVNDILADFKNGNKKGGYAGSIKYFANILRGSDNEELKMKAYNCLSQASNLRKAGKETLNESHSRIEHAIT